MRLRLCSSQLCYGQKKKAAHKFTDHTHANDVKNVFETNSAKFTFTQEPGKTYVSYICIYKQISVYLKTLHHRQI